MNKISFILIVFSMCLFACKNAPERPEALLDSNTQVVDPINTTTSATPPTAEPAQNAEGVWHYTCPSGCEGGGGAAGPCPKCGATLAHNAGYHGPKNNTTDPPASISTTVNGSNIVVPDASGAITPTNSPNAEPPQNESGVWHYTCPSGCEGGGGAAGPCPKCGATLAHNSGYH